MRRGHSRSRWTWLLALGALLIGALPSGAARAMDDEEGQQPGQVRAVKIGQSVLVVDEAGNAMMYEDPTATEEPSCEDLEACWGFTADGPAAIVISGRGDVVQSVDAASGTVIQETTPPP